MINMHALIARLSIEYSEICHQKKLKSKKKMGKKKYNEPAQQSEKATRSDIDDTLKRRQSCKFREYIFRAVDADVGVRSERKKIHN
jgi:hypothetical protein